MRALLVLLLLGGVANAEPRLVGEDVVSTPDDEFGGALSPDGQTIYFSKSAPHSYRYVMCQSHLRDGAWTTPEILPFSGRYTDSDPVLSPDGSSILWTSDRPVDGKTKHDYDIWLVDRTATGWSAPRRLPAPINTEASEFNASFAKSGTLYFSSTRGQEATGAIRVYRSHPTPGGGWSVPEDLTAEMDGPGADPYGDLDVMIDPDERYMLLGSVGRPEGFGHFDLFMSKNVGGKWQKPIHLPAPYNTPARDYAPHVSHDGKTLFFSSERGFALEAPAKPLAYDALVARLRSVTNGSGNIYQIDWHPEQF